MKYKVITYKLAIFHCEDVDGDFYYGALMDFHDINNKPLSVSITQSIYDVIIQASTWLNNEVQNIYYEDLPTPMSMEEFINKCSEIVKESFYKLVNIIYLPTVTKDYSNEQNLEQPEYLRY